MNSKQRAFLRAKANEIEPIFQIGKGGIGDNLIDQLSDALEARELIKVSILQTADMTAKDASAYLAEALGAESVQCIGNRFVLYRKSKEKPQIDWSELDSASGPKAKAPKPAQPAPKAQRPFGTRGAGASIRTQARALRPPKKV